MFKWCWNNFLIISTGFRFSKISVECSVHFCSCPCLIIRDLVIFNSFYTLQTLPVMKSGFSLCTCSLQGKTCNENRFFPVKNMYTGKTLFSLQGWVCSVGLKKANESDQAQTGFYVGFIFTFWFTLSLPTGLKSVNLQYNMLGRWVDGPNDSFTLWCFGPYADIGK
jgi:hypothetical protein